MKRNIFTFMLLLVLVAKTYPVDLSYVPSNTGIVFSVKVDSLTSESEITTQELINSLVMNDLAQAFYDDREDRRVSDAMTNSLTSILNFSTTTRVISLDNMYIALFDILNIKEFDLLMLKIARAEDESVIPLYDGKFRYLELDKSTFLAWDNKIFSIIVLESEDNENPNSTLDVISSIFSKESSISNEILLELEADTLWNASLWVDYDSISDKEWYSGIWQSLELEQYPKLDAKIKAEAIGSTITAKSYFKGKSIEVQIDTYTPNASIDSTTITKKIDKNMYSMTKANDMGFLSLSVKPKEFLQAIMSYLEGTELIDELNAALADSDNKDIIMNVINILTGDIVLSVTGGGRGYYDATLFIAFGINSKENAIALLKEFLSKEGMEEDVPGVIDGNFTIFSIDRNQHIIFDEKIVYYVTSTEGLDYILNGANDNPLSQEQSDLIDNSMYSLSINLGLFAESIGYLTIAGTPVTKGHNKTFIILDFNDEDVLNSLLNLLNEHVF